MEILTKEQLIPLRDALDDLLEFVESLQCKETPYFCRFLIYMKNNIEIGIHTGTREMELLTQVLLRDWKEANDLSAGIQRCRTVQDKLGDDLALCMQYMNLFTAVRKYFI